MEQVQLRRRMKSPHRIFGRSNGMRIAWLTNAKILWRIASAGIARRKVTQG